MKAAEASGGPEGMSADMVRQAREAVDDLLNGGICNLSRHTNMSEPLLRDLSYLPGENVRSSWQKVSYAELRFGRFRRW